MSLASMTFQLRPRVVPPTPPARQTQAEASDAPNASRAIATASVTRVAFIIPRSSPPLQNTHDDSNCKRNSTIVRPSPMTTGRMCVLHFLIYCAILQHRERTMGLLAENNTASNPQRLAAAYPLRISDMAWDSILTPRCTLEFWP